MRQKRQVLGFLGHTHTHTLSLSLSLSLVFWLFAASFGPVLSAQSPPTHVGLFTRTFLGQVTVTANLDPALRPTGFNPFTHIKMWLQVIGPDNHTYQIPVVCSSYQAENESDPPTATATYPVHFFPVELGLHSYSIVWSAPNTAGLTFGIPSHFSPPGKTFTAVPSANLGPWRTQGETQEPYEYPFAPHQVDGLGNRHYRWPLSAAWFNIINPASTLDSKRIEILDYMLSKNMNRIRFALTAIQDPTMVTHHVPAAGFAQGKFSHSVWPRKSPAPPAANNFQPANIDFERFDLDQWTQIDAFIGECASRNIHASVILALPHTASYENQIFGVTNQTATWPPATAPAITDPDSAFGTRWELYYWYTIGRLCTYTNIHYCPLLEYHVMGPGPFSNPNTNGFSHNFASGAATAFVALEPYLNREGTSRLMSVQGQRGSYYARPLASTTENGAAAVEDCATDMFTVGYENNGTSPSRLSLQISPFLDPSLHTFPNHIALHRGGELGKSSITQMHNYAGSDDPFNPPPPALGHRQLLESVYYAPRPIFIEEDWVAHENGVSSVSPLNNNEDNPYRRATKEILSQTVQNVCRTNPYSFDFLEYPVQVDPSVALAFAFLNFSQQDIAKATGNINGMKKFYRDAAWMTGIIAQGYLCWFSPFYADPALQNYNPPLNGLTTSESLKSAAIWALHNPWWTFVPDHSIVITQSPALQLVGPVIPLTPPGYAQRFPYELEAVAAYCSQVGSKQYIIYSPYGAFSPTQSPVPTTLTLHLARLQPGESFTYRFHNPDNYTPDAALQIGTTNASSQVVLTPGVLDPTAPYGEFVLEINP